MDVGRLDSGEFSCIFATQVGVFFEQCGSGFLIFAMDSTNAQQFASARRYCPKEEEAASIVLFAATLATWMQICDIIWVSFPVN